MPLRRQHLLSAPVILAVSACGAQEEDTVPPTEIALEQPIASDPDLVLSDENAAALTLRGGSSAGMPALDRSAATLVRIREAAVRRVGGNQAMMDAPDAQDERPMEGDILTLSQRFAAAGVASTACSRTVSYGGRFAATLPQPFALYPEAALQDAAGTDGQACNLRGAVFRSAAEVQELLDFYYTLATAAGFTQQRLRIGEDEVLSGTRPGRTFALHVRPLPDGGSEAELVTASD